MYVYSFEYDAYTEWTIEIQLGSINWTTCTTLNIVWGN